MSITLRFVVGVCLAVVVGCGSNTGTLKGKVVNGDKPVTTDGQLVSLTFHPLKPDGTPDPNGVTAPLGADGSFEFIASGGTLPPGSYRVVISGVSGGMGPPDPKKKAESKPKVDRFAPHNKMETSKLAITVKAGTNDVVVDLSKAGG